MSNVKNIFQAIEWLTVAQDATPDNGVSAWFSLVTGWQPSYIETTGYIINTFFDVSEYYDDVRLKKRAIAMADFLLEMQLENGAYRAYTPQQKKSEKVVVFDMGQDLLGITHAYEVTKNKKYLKSATRAADYLVNIQEKEGTWTKNTYGSTAHTYHTRVAWGLLKVYEISKKNKYKTAAIKNLRWAQSQQLPNGWFKKNELPPPNVSVPYTHTISYAIEGFLWSGLLLQEASFIKTALKGAVPLLNYFLKHGNLPGTFNNKWETSDSYSCLTGNAQISLMWLKLFEITKDNRFFYAAAKMNRYLESKQVKIPLKQVKGAIAGSDPIWGDLLKNTGYCRLAYLNWATKFFVDALLAEEKIRKEHVLI